MACDLRMFDQVQCRDREGGRGTVVELYVHAGRQERFHRAVSGEEEELLIEVPVLQRLLAPIPPLAALA